MTTEEKAKRYDEIVKVADKYRDTHIMFSQIEDEMFPELAESEDEKIRKQLLKHLREVASGKSLELSTTDYERWANWVEKQGEQKPAWSEEDEKQLQHAMLALQWYAGGTDITNWLLSIKERVQPHSQWKPSERQKEALLWCVVHLGGADKQTLGELLEELNKL